MRSGLEGKAAIVTGGASGIGEAPFLRMVAGGARVCIVDMNAQATGLLVARIGGDNVVSAVADVVNNDDVARSAQIAVEAFASIVCTAMLASLAKWAQFIRPALKQAMSPADYARLTAVSGHDRDRFRL